MDTIKGIITHRDKEFVFEVGLYVAASPDQLLMEQIEYYQKYTNKIPPVPHIEMEIMTLPPEAKNVELHIHPVGKRNFLCWTQHVADERKASEVFRTWCFGSVYTILTGIPFEKYLFNPTIKGNSDVFETELSREFGISFKN